MKLTKEQQELVTNNIGLARAVAHKFRRTCAYFGIDWDEAFSIACLGLVQAARKYDPEVAGGRSGYLYRACELTILQELRHRKSPVRTAFRTVSLHSVCAPDPDEKARTLEDTMITDERDVADMVIDRMIAEKKLAYVLENCTPQQRLILDMRANGMTQLQIAKTFGHEQAWVSREISKCRKLAQKACAT